MIEAELPDGRVLEFPDGTDRAVIQAKVKQYLGNGGASSSLNDSLATIDRMMAAQPSAQDRYNPEGSTTNYLAQQAKKGISSLVGLPVDTMTNLANLGIAGYGFLKGELTGSADLPEPLDPRNQFGGSASFERGMGVDNSVKPTSRGAEFAGRILRDQAAAFIPAMGFSRMAANPNTALAIQQGLTALASTTGEAARSVAPEGYEGAADLAGTLIGGVAVPAVIASRAQNVKGALDFAKDMKSPATQGRLADAYVQGQIQQSVKGYPGAAQNIDDALQAEQQIPGLNLRVGQASNVPSLLDMEKRVATAGPEQFNRRSLQDQAQQAAIRAEAERRLPLLAGKNDVAERLAATQSQRRDLADALPVVDPQDIGGTLRAARSSMKGRYDQIAAEKFSAPVQEAQRLNVKIDPSGIIEKASQLRNNPIVQFDATNAPAILSKIDDLSRVQDPGALILGPSGKPVREMVARKVEFSDLKALREAVNQDIAREAGSVNPNARQRLRALVDLKNEIDSAAQQAPESVRKLYNDATNWYRDVYAPKFLRGVNLKQTAKDITGEMRIPDEKLAAQYFKPLSATPMDRFLKLYSDSPQAMRAMESHVLDTYRKVVVKDGVLDPLKHEQFMKNYGAPLKKMPEMEMRLKSISSASGLLAEREAQLIDAQKILSQGELAALKYNNLPDSGLDPNKINAFLNRNGLAFEESIGAIYGKQAAKEHLTHLKTIAKAAEIADRGSLGPSAAPKQDINPAGMQGRFGFSGRTVFSLMRAVVTGRSSTHDMAYTLGAQNAGHRIGQALIAAEERAISDPETAKLIAQAVKQPASGKEGDALLKAILAKGGMYLTGSNKYAEYGKQRVVPFAIDATRQGIEQAQ